MVWTSKHLPGGLNLLADQGSRQYPILTEWSINQRTFDYILDRNGPLKLDVFATRENTHRRLFISPFPDPLAFGENALSLDWSQWEDIYLFPPVTLLPEVLAHLEIFRGRGVLIAPLFPHAAWFPNLLRRSKGHYPLPTFHTLSQMTFEGRVFHENPFSFGFTFGYYK